ncbi:MAG: YcaO-like family protein [Methanolinea sp.]|nr:YcaO-like family protein [Methanolinea sp.]
MNSGLSRTKKVFQDGTHRAAHPRDTEKAARPLMDAVGVEKIVDLGKKDRLGIPCLAARRRRAPRGASRLLPGTGRTRLLARVAAMVAAIERSFGEYQGQPLETDSYEALSSRGAIDPRSLILPRPLPAGEVLHWSEGWDLLAGEGVLVPSNAVFHPYVSRGLAAQLFQSDPVGLACGNTREEAILHGLLEVLERDAMSRAERRRDMGRKIVVDTGGFARELLEKFTAAGIDIHLWLLDGRTRAPVVAAAADDTQQKDPGLLVMGASCHTDPEIAVERALLDVAFSRASYLSGEISTPQRDMFLSRAGYERMKRINREWFAPAPEVSLSSIPGCSTTFIDGDIAALLDDLRHWTGRVCVVDLKPPPLPVVRVVVPGLEVSHHHKDRVATGRQE